MQIYLVGGAVRDKLLGRPVKEKDWVVVGATPDELIRQGFQPVGKDFPVFLHPETHEEYALARTERKVGKGYKGFTFYAAPDVTLEQDLKRRDLTVNAIAEDETGQLIDPFSGQEDLRFKRLRHVSEAFSEDPVRILRLARFAAKLPNFSIDPHTLELTQSMVKNGEVDALVAERVWKECEKALVETNPLRFFTVLEQTHAASVLWPALKLTPTLEAQLNACIKLNANDTVRLSVLWKDMEVDVLKQLIKRYKLPKRFSELLLLTKQQLSPYQQLLNKKDKAMLLQFLQQTDAFRRPGRFQDVLIACQACCQTDEQLNQVLLRALALTKTVDTREFVQQGLKGLSFANAVEEKRLTILEHELADTNNLDQPP